jgi:glutathione S-transferase
VAKPQANPLGKIPTLELGDGRAFYDSFVIIAYLDRLNAGRKLIPAGGELWLTAAATACVGQWHARRGFGRRIDKASRISHGGG